MTAAVELRGVSKRFGAVQANKDVDLVVEQGTIHAVVGENGAGKSTLLKLAYGQIRADEGEISLKGTPVNIAKHTPTKAISRGVGMVHQHFMLAATMTVVENVVLGREKMHGGFLDLDGPREELRVLSKRYGLDVDPDAIVEELSVGQQQRVEIVKVLWQGCDVLILDEPTAVLTPGEVEQLFAVLRELVAGGSTVVIITHKLDEVVEIADTITVMRRGEVVETLAGKGATPQDIARAMVGRPVLLRVDKTPATPGDEVLSVERVSVAGRGIAEAVHDATLTVRSGEIVGIAAVQGNGQSELFEAIAGLREVTAGTIKLGGANITRASVSARFTQGVAHVPEDRHGRGIILDFSVEENLVLGRQRELLGRLVVDRDTVREYAETCIEDFDVRPTDPDLTIRGLSGGNQQKVVMARELSRPASQLLLCGQPTRGVDVGAIELIHKRIIAARDEGLAVLLVSAELSELRALADRVVVMYSGRIVAELSAKELGKDDALARMGALMTGASS